MSSTIPNEALSELARTLERVTLGSTDSETAKKSAERMDRVREELRRKFGEFDIAVPSTREYRDGE